jgi:hypothetical protein
MLVNGRPSCDAHTREFRWHRERAQMATHFPTEWARREWREAEAAAHAEQAARDQAAIQSAAAPWAHAILQRRMTA